MVPNFQYVSVVLFYVVMIATLVLAWAKGGAPERIGAGLVIATVLIQFVFHAFLPPRLATVDMVSLLVDSMMLVGFGWLAIKARRVWPIWATACQLVSVASHSARYFSVEIDPIVYADMKSAPTLLAIIALAIGTIIHDRRLKRFGSDPAWMN